MTTSTADQPAEDSVGNLPGRPITIWPFLTCFGAAFAAVVCAQVWMTIAHLPLAEKGVESLTQALFILGFLLVPVSIFVPVVGSMFPQYWNATPVTIVIYSPMERMAQVITTTLGLGVGAIITSQFLEPPLMLVVIVWLGVGLAAVQALWLIYYSLSILDPDRLADIIAYAAARGGSFEQAKIALDDLARLTRGLKDRRRKRAAIRTIWRITAVLERHLGCDWERDGILVSNVLDECARRYKDDYAVKAIEACRKALASSQSGAAAARKKA